MLRAAEVLWLSEPLVPVMLTVEFPSVAPAVVLIVSVEVPEAAMELELKLPVAPAGNPDTPRFTTALKPFAGATVTV